jgi:hypothetical protein
LWQFFRVFQQQQFGGRTDESEDKDDQQNATNGCNRGRFNVRRSHPSFSFVILILLPFKRLKQLQRQTWDFLAQNQM